jgi:DNA mismatch repair protein MutS2
MVAPEDLRAEDLLDEIHHQRELTRRARQEAEDIRQRVADLEAQLSDRLDKIEDERLDILENARQEAQEHIQSVQDELATLRRQLSAARQPLEAIQLVEAGLEAMEEAVDEPVIRRAQETPVDDRPFQLGDKVLLTSLNAEGVITSIDAEQVEVQVGRLRVRAKLNELRHVSGGKVQSKKSKTPSPSRPTEATKTPLPAAPPLELDLRGRTVEEALHELDQRLDAAFVAGLPMVRVIHGKGTGALRQAVREALKGHVQVGSFSPGLPNEGGDGVTVIKLDL